MSVQPSPEARSSTENWKKLAEWASFPLVMGTFMGAAFYCVHRGVDPDIWVVVLALANFHVLLGLEWLLPRKPDHGVFSDGQILSDIGFNSLNALTRPLLASLAIVAVVWTSELGLTASERQFWPAHWPLGVQIIIAILAASLVDYGVHRSLHTFDRLWWFHSVHHSATRMHVLKGGRIHLIEACLHDFATPLPFLLLGAPVEVLLMSSMWNVFAGSIVHANVEQRFPSWAHYVLPTVQLHNLHHSTDRDLQDGNYSGTLPIWDWLFGTLRHPDHFEIGAMGLADDYMPHRFLSQLWKPFLWQVIPPDLSSPGDRQASNPT